MLRRVGGSPRSHWLACLLLCATCAACHEDDSGGSGICHQTSGCGGEVLGTWQIGEVCPNDVGMTARATDPRVPIFTPVVSSASIACSGAVENREVSVEGTLELAADGRYQQSGLATWTSRMRYDAKCVLEQTGMKVTSEACDMIGERRVGAPCQAAGSSCVCDVPQQMSLNRVGRYEARAGRIEFDGDLATVSEYCVRDEEVSLRLPGLGNASLQYTASTTSIRPISTTLPPSGTSPTVTPSSSGVMTRPGDSFPGSSGAAGSGATASGTTMMAPALEGVELHSGSAPLIDVFVGDRGVYVVTRDEVVLVDLEGEELARITAPRPITAAAFDGDVLAIADGAKLLSYDPDLEPVADGNLIEPCTSGVMVSGGRFVCGPGNDWDRIFYTYDTANGMLLASSQKFTYNGMPMRAAPGLDAFVAVSGGSPSDFFLYLVGDNDEVTFAGESPYHGDFRVTATYAWDAIPPKHLVTDTGLLLTVDPACAVQQMQTMMQSCFVKDGALGTLTGSQTFAAMDTDAEGKLHAIMVPGGASFPSSLDRAASVVLQRIDVAERVLESQKVVSLNAGAYVALRHVPGTKSVVVAYLTSGPTSSPFDMPAGPHRVALLDED